MGAFMNSKIKTWLPKKVRKMGDPTVTSNACVYGKSGKQRVSTAGEEP